MTDNNHPITPPHELVQQWVSLAGELEGFETWQDLATQAARWGSDQELEACDKAVRKIWQIIPVSGIDDLLRELRAARRPKPPSLKEQALQALNEAVYMADDIPPEGISTDQADIIRRALESLPESIPEE